MDRWTDALSAAERKDRLADAITALPEREKLVIAFAYYEGLSDTEIARVLGTSHAAVTRLRHRTVAKLQRSLGHEPFGDD